MADTFEWKDEYSVGIDMLDTQHQHMFELGNRITSLKPDETKQLITELHRYALRHFSTEEAHMKEIGYPETKRHRQQHEAIIENLNRMTAEFVPDERHTLKLKLFFFNWLTTHILQDDKLYVDFSNARRLAEANRP